MELRQSQYEFPVITLPSHPHGMPHYFFLPFLFLKTPQNQGRMSPITPLNHFFAIFICKKMVYPLDFFVESPIFAASKSYRKGERKDKRAVNQEDTHI